MFEHILATQFTADQLSNIPCDRKKFPKDQFPRLYDNNDFHDACYEAILKDGLISEPAKCNINSPLFDGFVFTWDKEKGIPVISTRIPDLMVGKELDGIISGNYVYFKSVYKSPSKISPAIVVGRSTKKGVEIFSLGLALSWYDKQCFAG